MTSGVNKYLTNSEIHEVGEIPSQLDDQDTFTPVTPELFAALQGVSVTSISTFELLLIP
jgi:hypothetical protein